MSLFVYVELFNQIVEISIQSGYSYTMYILDTGHIEHYNWMNTSNTKPNYTCNTWTPFY